MSCSSSQSVSSLTFSDVGLCKGHQNYYYIPVETNEDTDPVTRSSDRYQGYGSGTDSAGGYSNVVESASSNAGSSDEKKHKWVKTESKSMLKEGIVKNVQSCPRACLLTAGCGGCVLGFVLGRFRIRPYKPLALGLGIFGCYMAHKRGYLNFDFSKITNRINKLYAGDPSKKKNKKE